MNLYTITFSPTGGTQRAADLLAEALGGGQIAVDLTDSRRDFSAVALGPEDTALLAVHSYGGRAPALALERLAAVTGGGARAVLLCVYGNRAYEDTLVELADAAGAAGFRVVAAATAIAEHSVVRRYAAGRPDSGDEAQLREFARRIREKLSGGGDTAPEIPGNRPYKKAGGSGMVPKPTPACTGCGLCAERCPAQAIDPADPRHIRRERCVSCMRCVAVCPRSARKADDEALAAVDGFLRKVCAIRREGELYL